MSTLVFYLPFIAIYAIGAIYAERKISAFIQDRLGPMEVGYYGLAQSIADLLKLIQKEDLVPKQAHAIPFKIAPIIIFVAVFAGFSVIPLGPSWSSSALPSGVFLLIAIISLDVIGIVMAGWSSGNKYSLLGTFRSAAQMVSYEVPLGLSVLCVCMVCGSLDLQEMNYQQGLFATEKNYLLGLAPWNIETTAWGGIFTWNVVRFPLLFLAFIIFFIASLAECNRAPFDLPEAESELIAGFHTEYSGFRFAVIMLGEYGMMLLVSILGVILFFGGWNSPFPNLGDEFKLGAWTTGELGTITSLFWGLFWLIGKSLIWVGFQMWVRWTYPRLRVDQLMTLSWKYLTPICVGLIALIGFWKIYLS